MRLINTNKRNIDIEFEVGNYTWNMSLLKLPQKKINLVKGKDSFDFTIKAKPSRVINAGQKKD